MGGRREAGERGEGRGWKWESMSGAISMYNTVLSPYLHNLCYIFHTPNNEFLYLFIDNIPFLSFAPQQREKDFG